MALYRGELERKARRPLRELAVGQVRRRDTQVAVAALVPLLKPVEQRSAELADRGALGLLADAVDEDHADARRASGLRDQVLLDRLPVLHQATRTPR